MLPGHKGLYGPQGTGLLLVNTEEKIKEVMSGGTGSESKLLSQPEIYPDFFESGTLNTPGAAGLSAGISFVKNEGKNAVRQKEEALCSFMIDRLSDMGNVTVYHPGKVRCGLFSFNIEGMDCETVAKFLDDASVAVRSGLHCSPLAHQTMGTQNTGTVRVSCGFFNTKSEAVALCDAVSRIRKQGGSPAKK